MAAKTTAGSIRLHHIKNKGNTAQSWRCRYAVRFFVRLYENDAAGLTPSKEFSCKMTENMQVDALPSCQPGSGRQACFVRCCLKGLIKIWVDSLTKEWNRTVKINKVSLRFIFLSPQSSPPGFEARSITSASLRSFCSSSLYKTSAGAVLKISGYALISLCIRRKETARQPSPSLPVRRKAETCRAELNFYLCVSSIYVTPPLLLR